MCSTMRHRPSTSSNAGPGESVNSNVGTTAVRGQVKRVPEMPTNCTALTEKRIMDLRLA